MTQFLTAALLLLYQTLNKHTLLTQVSIYGVSQYPGEQVEKDGHWHIHSDHKWQSSLHSRLRLNCFPSCSKKNQSVSLLLLPCFSRETEGGSCRAPLLTAGALWNTQTGGQCSSEADQIRCCYWFTLHTEIQTLSKWVNGSIIRPQIKAWRASEHAEKTFLQVTSRQKHKFITESKKK